MDTGTSHTSAKAAVSATPLIDVRAVEVTLASQAGPVEILRGLDLRVEAGESLGIVGPSGSGKTTLLMVLAGLEAIQAGYIRVNGVDPSVMNEDELACFRRDTIGIVFQSFHLIATMTALENVAIPLEFRGERNAFELARAWLERVGLGHRLHHYPGQLSGGEQQRVAMARALAPGTKILLADEPTGNLDEDTGRRIIDLLFELQAETGLCLLLVTHARAIAGKCRRIVQVRDGRIV